MMERGGEQTEGHDWKMSPASEQKYHEKVFAQDIQEQMGHDVANVWPHLVGQQQEGKEWVAYPDIERVGKDDLQVFDTRQEARDYVLGQSNVAVMYDYNLIDRVIAALDPLVVAAIEKHFERNPIEPEKGNENEIER